MLKEKTLFAISFDSVPLSGLIVEFIKTAEVFKDKGYKVHLELGYDIKNDKKNLFRQYTTEHKLLPSWVDLTRLDTLDEIPGYNQELLAEVLNLVRSSRYNEADTGLYKKINEISHLISKVIIKKWEELDVDFVIVENGTLPENIIFTKALHEAIETYGEAKKLKKYVLWRDHDLMWSSEPNLCKYGCSPYHHTPKFKKSQFIQHVVLHDADLHEAKKWCPEAETSILPNTFCIQKSRENICSKFRAHLSIPEDAIVIARITRMIYPKRIDRDIHLVDRLTKLLKDKSIDKQVYLVIAGSADENNDEYLRLQKLIDKLGLSNNIIFCDYLLPFGAREFNSSGEDSYSVKDLLENSDICSFLTSYNYESYGNPISEAIAAGTPYVATTYERYNVVYGRKGFKGILLDINEENDAEVTVNDGFVNEVFSIVNDRRKANEYTKHNFDKAKKHFASKSSLINNLHTYFGSI
ncbi:MAG: glycosyltransferase family 4 protein [Lentisphaerae bacterium]|nr:glycosyltransferase family 4 protein [Lentisphaerota bacterium]MCP4102762.1 glycosyltransferase family 4 protein [Lentisphaerota bacterium]